MFRSVIITLLLTTAALAAVTAYLARETGTTSLATSISEAMPPTLAGYRNAEPPASISFPIDHGPHPDFKLEWWYFTGNLRSESGDHLGYQLTFFRNALLPDSAHFGQDSTGWRTHQLYLAHFAITHAASGDFHAVEKVSRGAAGLAGAEPDPMRVWLDDWYVERISDARFRLRLVAQTERTGIDLELNAIKPIVLQGDEGFSRKGSAPGQASFYYSVSRLETAGRVTFDGETFVVSGLSWMDREWSSLLLTPEQTGWDWFSIQLDDGRDLMFFQLRERNPINTPYRHAVIIDHEGRKRRLQSAQVQVDVLDTWTSPETDVTYPAAWRLRLPEERLDLMVRPYVADQELNVSVLYWEGPVYVSDAGDGGAIRGSGYVELTGYGDDAPVPGG